MQSGDCLNQLRERKNLLSLQSTPIPASYWVAAQFLAGEHPSWTDDDSTRKRIRCLLDAQVSLFIDLTQDEEEPYLPIAQAESSARQQEIEYWQMHIQDMNTPSNEKMRQILHRIDAAIEAGRTVYVHCLAGLGRTGTVVGCYLVNKGMDGHAALREITHLRRQTPEANEASPQTEKQRQFVLKWQGAE